MNQTQRSRPEDVCVPIANNNALKPEPAFNHWRQNTVLFQSKLDVLGRFIYNGEIKGPCIHQNRNWSLHLHCLIRRLH